MEITNELIDLLKGTYEANKEDLRELEVCIAKYGVTDDGCSDVTESFEQGYNNAMEFVFKVLGIKY